MSGINNAPSGSGLKWTIATMLKTLILSITCLLCTNALADDYSESDEFRSEYEIFTETNEKKNNECFGGKFSTADMANCQYEEIDRLDAELNRVYQILMKRMNTQSRDALRASQRLWLKYRDLEYDFIDEQMSTKKGTLYINVRIRKRSDVLANRVDDLHSHLHTLNN